MKDESSLLIKYEYLISLVWNKEIIKNKTTLFWKEDIFQEGRIGLLIAIRKYNKEFGKAFEGYAYTGIKNKMTRSIQLHYNNRYGLSDNKTVSLYTEIADDLFLIDTITDIKQEESFKHIEREYYLEGIYTILETLKEKPKEVIERILQGKNFQTISKEIHITRQSVSDKYYRFIRKVKSYLIKKAKNVADLPKEEDYKNREFFIKDLTTYLGKRSAPFQPTKKYLKRN